jgi:glutathione S-transferase
LNFSSGNCHRIADNLSVPVDVQVEHKTETGESYPEINPKGYVPYLAIDSDTGLSEGAAILQYLADQNPEGNLSPPLGAVERYKMQEWLTFIGTDPQRIIGSFFTPGNLTQAGLEFAEAILHKRLAIMDDRLADNEYLMGADYTIADAYAFAILNWIPLFKLDIDISNYKNLVPYLEKICLCTGFTSECFVNFLTFFYILFAKNNGIRN